MDRSQHQRDRSRTGTARRAPRRLALAALTTGMLLLTPGSVATADTPLGHSGLVGRHHLRDTASHAGANCFYEDGDSRTAATEILIMPPRVWARDHTPGEDSQTVGYRTRLRQSSDGGTTWHTTFTSPIVKRSATDATRAHLPSRTYLVPENARVRALVLTFWYKPGSTTAIQGRATNRIDWYGRTHFIFLDIVPGSCGKMPGTS